VAQGRASEGGAEEARRTGRGQEGPGGDQGGESGGDELAGSDDGSRRGDGAGVLESEQRRTRDPGAEGGRGVAGSGIAAESGGVGFVGAAEAAAAAAVLPHVPLRRQVGLESSRGSETRVNNDEQRQTLSLSTTAPFVEIYLFSYIFLMSRGAGLCDKYKHFELKDFTQRDVDVASDVKLTLRVELTKIYDYFLRTTTLWDYVIY
jgi:hypothetical protein